MSLVLTILAGLFALIGVWVGFITLITVLAQVVGVSIPKKLRGWGLGFKSRGRGAMGTALFGLALILLFGGLLWQVVVPVIMDRIAGKTEVIACTVEDIDYWTGGRVYCKGLKEPLELFGAFGAQADVPVLLALAKFRGVPINVEYWPYSRQIKQVWFERPVKVDIPKGTERYVKVDIKQLPKETLENLNHDRERGVVDVPVQPCLVTRVIKLRARAVPTKIIKVGCYDASIKDTRTRYYEVVGNPISGKRAGRIVGMCAEYLVSLPILNDQYVHSRELVAECKKVVR